MNDAKITVKKALSFVLVVVLIVATLFGLDVPFDFEDVANETENTAQEVVVTDENNDKKTHPPTDEVETDTPQETAPTDDVEDAEGSVNGEVAEPNQPQDTATEGEVKNA